MLYIFFGLIWVLFYIARCTGQISDENRAVSVIAYIGTVVIASILVRQAHDHSRGVPLPETALTTAEVYEVVGKPSSAEGKQHFVFLRSRKNEVAAYHLSSVPPMVFKVEKEETGKLMFVPYPVAQR